MANLDKPATNHAQLKFLNKVYSGGQGQISKFGCAGIYLSVTFIQFCWTSLAITVKEDLHPPIVTNIIITPQKGILLYLMNFWNAQNHFVDAVSNLVLLKGDEEVFLFLSDSENDSLIRRIRNIKRKSKLPLNMTNHSSWNRTMFLRQLNQKQMDSYKVNSTYNQKLPAGLGFHLIAIDLIE